MEKRRTTYYRIDNPPLLLQGFDKQFIQVGVQDEDSQQFQLEVNRGVVNWVDYSSVNDTIVSGFTEVFWNNATIDLLAGGQELLRALPAERFDYNLDLGTVQEQRIQTWINGGQTLNSKLSIDPAATSPINEIQTQLHCYYTTQEYREWLARFKWKSGLGLKRRAYSLEIPNAPGIFNLEDVLPKNQGNIIGFSMLFMMVNAFESVIDLSVDGLTILKNVSGERFSRANQKDPQTFLIPLHPGSTFNLQCNTINTTNSPGRLYLTFYFDN